MKVLIISALAVICLAEPPVDNRYLPPQAGGGAPSQLYDAPGAGPQRQTDALFRSQPSRNGGRRPSSQYGAPHSSQYSAPSAQYGAPGVGSQAPSAQYGAPSSQFGAPSSQYGAPSSQFGAQSAQFGAPSSQYGALSSQYGAPSAGSPSQQYGAPSAGSLSQQYSAPSAGSPSQQYGAPSAGSPSQQYGAPSAGAPSQQYGAPGFGGAAGGHSQGGFGGNSYRGQEQSRQYLPPGANGYSGNGYSGDDGSNGEPANYSFEYMVKDEQSGNDFGHRESRQGDRAEGLYYVLLPDGRKQTVEYEADQGGYKPKISYEDTGLAQGGYDRNSQSGYNGYQGQTGY